jgi:hypothetical protein
MIKKALFFYLMVVLFLTPVFAETLEASIITDEAGSVNFWQEADITFWQTLPFATFWGFLIDGSLSGLLSVSGAPHWAAIVSVAAIISAGNAVSHARKVTEVQK